MHGRRAIAKTSTNAILSKYWNGHNTDKANYPIPQWKQPTVDVSGTNANIDVCLNFQIRMNASRERDIRDDFVSFDQSVVLFPIKSKSYHFQFDSCGSSWIRANAKSWYLWNYEKIVHAFCFVESSSRTKCTATCISNRKNALARIPIQFEWINCWRNFQRFFFCDSNWVDARTSIDEWNRNIVQNLSPSWLGATMGFIFVNHLHGAMPHRGRAKSNVG